MLQLVGRWKQTADNQPPKGRTTNNFGAELIAWLIAAPHSPTPPGDAATALGFWATSLALLKFLGGFIQQARLRLGRCSGEGLDQVKHDPRDTAYGQSYIGVSMNHMSLNQDLTFEK